MVRYSVALLGSPRVVFLCVCGLGAFQVYRDIRGLCAAQAALGEYPSRRRFNRFTFFGLGCSLHRCLGLIEDRVSGFGGCEGV